MFVTLATQPNEVFYRALVPFRPSVVRIVPSIILLFTQPNAAHFVRIKDKEQPLNLTSQIKWRMINAVIYATFAVAKRKPEKNLKKKLLDSNPWSLRSDTGAALYQWMFFSGFLFATAKVAYITAMISILHLINHGTVTACLHWFLLLSVRVTHWGECTFVLLSPYLSLYVVLIFLLLRVSFTFFCLMHFLNANAIKDSLKSLINIWLTLLCFSICLVTIVHSFFQSERAAVCYTAVFWCRHEGRSIAWRH